jgi:hypothetical protein
MALETDSKRKALYRDVEYERLSPAEADERLRTLGLQPFEKRPDPSTFDPMLEAEWTLPMAAAWFIWRSPDAVRDQWNLAREGWRKWTRIQKPRGAVAGPRWKLKSFGRATLVDVFSQVSIPRDLHSGNASVRKGG